jgi:prephenate dehydratase
MNEILKIGISGAPGSFSEEAANYYCYQNKIADYKLDYLLTVEGVLKAVNEDKVDKGIFPIENSNGGIVYEAVYAMSQYNFFIENIFEIDVRHNLLVRPGIAENQIKKIVSHQQALRQCRMYLRRRWPNIELEEYKDTALAASDLASGILPENVAVIAAKNCAELYKLEFLEKNIQDLKFNFTTFIACRKKE